MFSRLMALLALFTFAFSAPAFAEDIEIEADKWLAAPKAYVGSKVCKSCHLEHYDAWQRTLHSRMLQDAVANADVIVTEIDPKIIKEDFKKIEKKLKVPIDEVMIPDVKDVKYTIGSQWKQRYLIKKDGDYYIAPTQYNINTGTWVNYHEHDWNKRPWLLKCGGCHATGVDLEKKQFVEPGVGCEACHGPGSHHAALPASEIFEKRSTIVNPSKLTGGIAVQVCGACHNRGKSTHQKGSGWPVGYTPGKALESFYKSIGPGSKKLYSNGFSKGHHQQYIDWKNSKHADSGINCMTCHSVHELGNPTFRSKTKVSGDQLCTSCHQQTGKVGAHAVHTFGNCANCHMPRIAKSADAGDIRSHNFKVVLPKDTLAIQIPNSCQGCHHHENDDASDLQRRWDELTARRVKPGMVVKATE